jgi:hypothetical protein
MISTSSDSAARTEQGRENEMILAAEQDDPPTRGQTPAQVPRCVHASKPTPSDHNGFWLGTHGR